jgi:opacity protein-like surface antigen
MSARRAAAAAVLCLLSPAMAAAQAPAPRPAAAAGVGVRGFVDAGVRTFTAADSFEAVLGTRSATIAGIGGEIVLPQRIFANVRVSWFEQTGERVFVFEGETFPLGIDTTVRIVPVEITGGYRFAAGNRRVIPYAGGGVGWHRYEETSEFAASGENVSERFRGFHVLGGAEIRVARWLGVGGEVQWTTVPDALGADPNSVAAAFGEDDLGGTAVRLKVVIGR